MRLTVPPIEELLDRLDFVVVGTEEDGASLCVFHSVHFTRHMRELYPPDGGDLIIEGHLFFEDNPTLDQEVRRGVTYEEYYWPLAWTREHNRRLAISEEELEHFRAIDQTGGLRQFLESREEPLLSDFWVLDLEFDDFWTFARECGFDWDADGFM
jgi:hypothetical protein